jgi:hypothetical protein
MGLQLKVALGHVRDEGGGLPDSIIPIRGTLWFYRLPMAPIIPQSRLPRPAPSRYGVYACMANGGPNATAALLLAHLISSRLQRWHGITKSDHPSHSILPDRSRNLHLPVRGSCTTLYGTEYIPCITPQSVELAENASSLLLSTSAHPRDKVRINAFDRCNYG